MVKKGKRGNGGQGSTDLVIYRGPIKTTSAEPQRIRVALKQRITVGSTAAGYIETYIGTGSAYGNPEFGSYAALWREYRVLGLEYAYMPWYDAGGYIGSSNALSVGFMAPYHGASPSFQGAVTTNTDLLVCQMDGSKPFHPGKPLTVQWRMNDIEEAQFFNTTGAYSVGGIYGVVPTVTASRNYGTCVITVLIEFKGRV